jgi:hypothetical protein
MKRNTLFAAASLLSLLTVTGGHALLAQATAGRIGPIRQFTGEPFTASEPVIVIPEFRRQKLRAAANQRRRKASPADGSPSLGAVFTGITESSSNCALADGAIFGALNLSSGCYAPDPTVAFGAQLNSDAQWRGPNRFQRYPSLQGTMGHYGSGCHRPIRARGLFAGPRKSALRFQGI